MAMGKGALLNVGCNPAEFVVASGAEVLPTPRLGA